MISLSVLVSASSVRETVSVPSRLMANTLAWVFLASSVLFENSCFMVSALILTTDLVGWSAVRNGLTVAGRAALAAGFVTGFFLATGRDFFFALDICYPLLVNVVICPNGTHLG